MKLAEVTQTNDVPDGIMLPNGFYMEPKKKGVYVSWWVKRLMDDDHHATVIINTEPSGEPNKAAWGFRLNVDDALPQYVYVSKSQAQNYMKLKWWVTNRLIEAKLLPPIKDAHAN